MRRDLAAGALKGLGRSCKRREAITPAPAYPGIERMEARFFGDAFAPHRHDTYALGVTLQGVQTFRYRGEKRFSLPGKIIVLHPDELHDGGAGTDDGLRYRMLYLEPAVLQRHLEEQGGGLPFVRQPVLEDPGLRAQLLAALGSLDEGLDELFVDALVAELARGLTRHAGRPSKPVAHPAIRQARLARDYLEANATRLISSAELERVSGLDRYALARHFRALYATSPHRFLLMRRLRLARGLIEAGEPLADVAVVAGFADQSHLNRQFKKAFGMTPGRWAALTACAGQGRGQ